MKLYGGAKGERQSVVPIPSMGRPRGPLMTTHVGHGAFPRRCWRTTFELDAVKAAIRQIDEFADFPFSIDAEWWPKELHARHSGLDRSLLGKGGPIPEAQSAGYRRVDIQSLDNISAEQHLGGNSDLQLRAGRLC